MIVEKIKRSLALQMIIPLTILIIVVLLMVGAYSNYIAHSTTDAAKSDLLEWTHVESVRIQSFLKGIEGDLLFLASLPAIQGMIRAAKNKNLDPLENTSYETLKKRLETTFFHFAENKPRYMQIRFLDKQGNEIVRVDSDGKKVIVIPDDALRNRAKNDYFKETATLSSQEIYVSALNLNNESGKIEQPFKPVIRYATPIFDSDNSFQGIVILDVFATFILEPLKNNDFHVYLINKQGFYLKNSANPKQEWGFMLDKDIRIQQDFPNIADDILSVADEGILGIKNKRLLVYHTIPINQRFNRLWILIADADREVILNSILHFKISLWSFAALITLFTGVFAFLFIRKIISTINTLTHKIDEISQGNFCERVTITRQDEIGQLGKMFNIFVDKMSDVIKNVVNVDLSITQTSKKLMDASSKMSSGVKDAEARLAFTATSSEHIATSMNDIAIAIEDSSTNVFSVSSAIQQLSASINTIAASAEQVSINMEEIGDNFDKISKDINTVAESSEQESFALADVSESTRRAMEISNDANASAQENLETMSKLSETAEKIGRVVKLIDKIAAQTNMLALNATIEAASAGTAGKGFAVVAAEVKDLAQQTAEANSEIAQQIEQIQSYAIQTSNRASNVTKITRQVADINQAIDKSVKEQNKVAADIKYSINRIADSIQESLRNFQEANLGLKEISYSSAEASLASKESARALEEASNCTKDVVHSSVEASNSLQKINQHVQSLRKTMEQMVCDVDKTEDIVVLLSNMALSLRKSTTFFKINQENEEISDSFIENAMQAQFSSIKTDSLIVWNISYSVNFEEIDRQHKMLVDLINQLHRGITRQINGNTIKDILGYLVDYTVFHFSFEERLMEEHDFPENEMLEHEKEHENFKKIVLAQQKKLVSGDDTAVGKEVLDFLKNWLLNHIMKVDKKLGNFLSQKLS